MAEGRSTSWGNPEWDFDKRLRMMRDVTNMPALMGDASHLDQSRYAQQVRFQDQLNKDAAFTRKVASKASKTPATFGPLGWAFVGVDTISNMKQGDSVGTAAFKGIASGMLWTTMPGIMTAHMLATAAPGMYSAANSYMRQKELWWNQAHRGSFGGNYADTQRAQTMRQAAIEAIQGSKLNARSALGGEARILANHMYRG